MGKALVSGLVFIASLALWLSPWYLIIGFEQLRHDPFLWLGFSGFLVLSVYQIVWDLGEHGQVEDGLDGATDALLSATASILLAVSLLVSLVQLAEEPPMFEHTPFYFSSLATFLWIVLGVFSISWLEALEANRCDGLPFRLLRSMKRAAFFQALGWAAIAAVSLMDIMKRQSGI